MLSAEMPVLQRRTRRETGRTRGSAALSSTQRGAPPGAAGLRGWLRWSRRMPRGRRARSSRPSCPSSLPRLLVHHERGARVRDSVAVPVDRDGDLVAVPRPPLVDLSVVGRVALAAGTLAGGLVEVVPGVDPVLPGRVVLALHELPLLVELDGVDDPVRVVVRLAASHVPVGVEVLVEVRLAVVVDVADAAHLAAGGVVDLDDAGLPSPFVSKASTLCPPPSSRRTARARWLPPRRGRSPSSPRSRGVAASLHPARDRASDGAHAAPTTHHDIAHLSFILPVPDNRPGERLAKGAQASSPGP